MARVQDPWPAEALLTLRSLERSLEAGVERGDPHTLQPLQVVVAYIAELEGPKAAGLEL